MSGSPINETARIEAFSDGIFSIAATLLVLNLKNPPLNQPFWPAIAHMWPGYISFVLSFFFIGIMWINHHRLFVHITKSDDLLMAANLFLLLGVVFVPYPTALMAASITMLDSAYSRDVALFYNATYLMMSLLFNLLGSSAASGTCWTRTKITKRRTPYPFSTCWARSYTFPA